MPTEIVTRRARLDEKNAVHELIQTIADETFAYLFAAQVPTHTSGSGGTMTKQGDIAHRGVVRTGKLPYAYGTQYLYLKYRLRA